jgi:hypothetical protein
MEINFKWSSLLLLSGDVEINPGPGGTSNIANENILSIFHCNIRSLRNKLNYIADIIEEFDIVFFTAQNISSNKYEIVSQICNLYLLKYYVILSSARTTYFQHVLEVSEINLII